MSEVEPSVPTPRNGLFPTNLPEWITAISGVGTLLVGVVALWAAMRVGGIEDYLRSEIALRNRQVVQAEDRVEAAKGENDDLRQQRARLAEDVSFSQRQLTYNQFSDVVSGMRPSGANDAFMAQYDNPPRAIPSASVNPGADLLERVINHYRDSENPHEASLARRLRSRCSTAMDTPLQLAGIPAALPMPSRSESNEDRAGALADWMRSSQAFSAAAQARDQAVREAHNNAARALRSCALDILNNR